MEGIIRRINLAYYLIYTLTILSTIIGYMMTMNTENTVSLTSNLSITLSSVVILYIIISIPSALALFHRYTKKLALMEDKFTKLNKYASAATLRLLVVGSGLVISVIVFYIIRNQSIIFCAGISAIALLFCKPTEGKIISDLKLEDEE